MKDLDHPHSDTPHSTNSEDTDAVYEQFLQSLELELESDEPEVEAVNQKSPPHVLSLDERESEDIDSIEPIDNSATADESLLFAEIDLEEETHASFIQPNRSAADDHTIADKLKTSAETPKRAGETLQDTVADNSDLVESAPASAHSKNIFSRFKKPQLSKALRKKPKSIKAPKKAKTPKKDGIAKASTAAAKPNAAKNRLMILIIGGLLLSLALVFMLISTDVLAPLIDDFSADTGSEVATVESINSEAQNPEIAASASTAEPTPETNGADNVAEEAPAGVATVDTPTTAEAGVTERQNAVISYEEFTEEADTTLYRDTNE